MNNQTALLFLNRLNALLPRYVKEGVVVLSGDVLSKLLTFLISVMLIRFVTPAEYSYFGAFVTVVAMFNIIVDGGLNQSVIKFYGQYSGNDPRRAQSFIAFTLRLKLTIIPVAAFLLYIFSPFISRRLFHTDTLTEPFRLLTLGLIGAGLFDFTGAILQARQRYVTLSMARVAEGSLKFGYVLFFILIGAFSLEQVYLAYTVIPFGIGIVIVFIIGLHRERVLHDRKEISAELWRFAKWLVVLSYAKVVTTHLDMLLVQYLLPESKTDVGLYSLANRLCQPLVVLAGSVFTLMNPKAMALKSKAQAKEYIRQSFTLTIPLSGLSVLYMIGLYILLPHYAPSYAAAYPAFFVLCLGWMVVILSNPVTLLIYTIGKSNVAAGIAAFQLCATAVLDYFFILQYGAIGAAFSSLIIWVLCAGLSLAYLRRHRHLFPDMAGMA